MSPGSSRRERTTASAGASVRPARSGAAAAPAGPAWPAAGPRRQRCLPCGACLGQAQRFALFVRLGQGHLRGAAGAVHVLGADAAPLRVGGDAAQPRRSCRARAASACAATSRLRAWAISSGREPLRRRSSVCCCASICARAWSACSASVRVSSTASTAPARTRSPLRRAVPARGHCRRRPARSGGCPRCRSRRDRRRCRAG